uniref:Integrase catalytic domain-containing protein n=1 Tax=Tanacetum cinerariifolium TaxID=118510 RepID=A0A6L2LW49_TANCI|nr:hypothetical protein [Tanacetum cinerariifolium]
MYQPNPTFAKILILDIGKFEQWKFRIQQYLQNKHYALWEVIESVDSYKALQEEAASESSVKKKGRTAVITTEDMQKRRIDYGNFKAEGSETLEQTFNRLQAIISHLEFMDVEIEQDDLNQKFLNSLAPEWLMWSASIATRWAISLGSAEHPGAKTGVEEKTTNKSYMANEEENHALVADDEAPIEFALMAKSSSSSKNVCCSPLPAQVYSPPKKDMSWTGLPEFADDTITDYSRPSPIIESNTSDLQNSNTSVFEHEESSKSIMYKPMIKFVKAADSPTVIKTNKVETARKPSVKYAEMYRNTLKSPKVRGNQSNWNNLKFQQLGKDFLMKNKACFKCGHFDRLAYDCGVWVEKGKNWPKNNFAHKNVTPRADLLKTGRTPIAVNRTDMNVAQPKRTSFAKPAHSYGKQHKASCKTKLVNSVSKPLHTLHMDLFGPTSISILNHKWYCLVVTDDFSRCDNGGEFKNKEMNEFCTRKGINREFNNAGTPQQNGVAERRNRTLIEAARAMVLVNKSQNKTPYELFNSRTRAIGFLRPFGCHIMILNTLDHLGKFDAKGVEGYFIGYSMSSKAFKDATSQAMKKDVSSLRYIALPNWFHEAHLETSNNDAQDACNADAPQSSGISNPTATSTIHLADQIETLTVESEIPTFSSPVLTACLDNSPETSSDTRLISKGVNSQEETPSLDNILTLSNRFKDILGDTTNTVDTNGVEADLSNMESIIPASPTPTFRIHKDHPKSQIIGHVDTLVQTRHKSKEMEEHSFIATIHQKTTLDLLQFCLFSCFLSQEEPKKIFDALKHPWVRCIGTKWVLKNKKDERGIVIRNKARLVAQGHTQEEGIDYEEVFAPVARIEAIRLFLAYASFMRFTVYQVDVKSAFLYSTIDEEVYLMQPPRFQDPQFPDRVYKVEKAMYGLHQAPRAWYGTLSRYLLANGFQRGTIDQTLFIRKHRGYFLLVQVYVDDIIFGSSNSQLCKEFEALMHDKFQMSAMDVRSSNNPIDKENPWGKDGPVKRIFRYLKGHPKLVLWYPKESPFDLVAYSDSDYDGATQDRKSTTRGCQFLGRRLISWQYKK